MRGAVADFHELVNRDRGRRKIRGFGGEGRGARPASERIRWGSPGRLKKQLDSLEYRHLLKTPR
jgi:hypothetical protein